MTTYKISFLTSGQKSHKKIFRNNFLQVAPSSMHNSKTKILKQQIGFPFAILDNQTHLKNQAHSLSKDHLIQKNVPLKTVQLFGKKKFNLKEIINRNQNQLVNLVKQSTIRLHTQKLNSQKKGIDKYNFIIHKQRPKKSFIKQSLEVEKAKKKLSEYCNQKSKRINTDNRSVKFNNNLTNNQLEEILKYDHVYYFGQRKRDQKNNVKPIQEDGFLKLELHDHIGYRYEILSFLGEGSFGQVFKAFDHKNKELIAIKIIKNKSKFQNQSQIQIKLLTFIKQKDPNSKSNIISINQYFTFRNHTCIVFELLHKNLYSILKARQFQGFSMELIHRFAIQILKGLLFFQKHKIIHCDMKPENILLKHQNGIGIKIIDLGSSCFQNQRIYNYIQSRFYRAPEIIFGLNYTTAIDMWSFGCLLVQIYLGLPLFPGDSEQQQISLIIDTIGYPSKRIIESARRNHRFFDQQNFSNNLITKPLEKILKSCDSSFISFIRELIVWDPTKRMKASKALTHQWIINGLSKKNLEQHMQEFNQAILQSK